MTQKVEAFKEDLELFETPNDKLDYILDLSKNFKGLPQEAQNDANLIKGCSSKAWLTKEMQDGKIILKADAESLIAKGMLTLLLAIFSNRSAEEILAFNPKELENLGFAELLSPVRLQGLDAFLHVIYTYAQKGE